MPPVYADNVTKLVLEGQWTNNRKLNVVMHYQRVEDSPSESAQDVANNWQDHIVEMFANNYTYLGVRYTDIEGPDGVTGFIPRNPAKVYVGTGVGEALPPAMSVLVHKNIEGRVGRRSGRVYMGAPQENQVDENGILQPAIVTAFNAQWNDFRNGTDDENGHICVLHNRAGVVSTSHVLSYTVDSLLATQRRRMRG